MVISFCSTEDWLTISIIWTPRHLLFAGLECTRSTIQYRTEAKTGSYHIIIDVCWLVGVGWNPQIPLLNKDVTFR